ncbi:MAG: hypothetical protein EON94_05700, partial [Caulobacteraceae bacterium]
MARRPGMSSWYNPAMLVRTGIRVAISTVFGQFADRREAMAAANAIAPSPFDVAFDYSGKAGSDGFWFDYVADTGDGWNSTYAMARLLAQEAIELDDRLPRGQLLIMGGDQVYPTASREDYGERLLDPFDQAHDLHSATWPEKAPDLYAIPGNHDWYDGLNSFFGLFCRRRIAGPMAQARDGKVIGGRQTQQSRSYFAIRLPDDWWIWGTDSQLEGYIDQPQIDYFLHAATEWMNPGSKLILCVGEPSWVHADPKDPEKSFNSFSYLEWLAEKSGRGHRLRVVLTGDSHHYARYMEDDRHYIVCGGGGAFLHPTHQLKSIEFPWRHPRPNHAATGSRSFRLFTRYPSAMTSFGLAFRNLLFPLLNPLFTLVFALSYGVFNWLLNVNARVNGGTLASALDVPTVGGAVEGYWNLLFVSPWPTLLLALACGGYYYFAAVKNSWGRFAVGFVHWVVQTFVALVVTWQVMRCSAPPEAIEGWASAKPVIVATLAAALAGSAVFGLYLLTSINVFGAHYNEAFSSLRIAGYKSFLRMRIRPGGDLEIQPVGLRRT